MKTRHIQFVFFSFLLAFTTFSCQKDNGVTGPEPINANSFFSCQKDGLLYEAQGFKAYAAAFDESINIYGLRGANLEETIYIEIPKGITRGTYNFNQQVFAYVVQPGKAFSTRLGDGFGKVIIESFDGKNIAGTFAFEAVNFDDLNESVQVEDGKFQVTIRD